MTVCTRKYLYSWQQLILGKNLDYALTSIRALITWNTNNSECGCPSALPIMITCQHYMVYFTLFHIFLQCTQLHSKPSFYDRCVRDIITIKYLLITIDLYRFFYSISRFLLLESYHSIDL